MTELVEHSTRSAGAGGVFEGWKMGNDRSVRVCGVLTLSDESYKFADGIGYHRVKEFHVDELRPCCVPGPPISLKITELIWR